MDMFSKNITDAETRRQVDPLRKDSLDEQNRKRELDAHSDPTPAKLKVPKDMIREPEDSIKPIQDDLHPELEEAYKKGEVHPLDLKKATAKYLIEMLEPVREFFKKNPKYLKPLK